MADVVTFHCGHVFEPWSMVCGRALLGPNHHAATEGAPGFVSFDCPVHGEVFVRVDGDVGVLDAGLVRWPDEVAVERPDPTIVDLTRAEPWWPIAGFVAGVAFIVLLFVVASS